MLHKTRGVVFRLTKYAETSVIVTIFTEVFGLQSYIVNGVRSKTAKNKIALYQPLTLLDLVVYHRAHANLERIKEIHCLHPYQSLTLDVKKSTMAMFITELVNRTVKEESHAKEMFDFLYESLVVIDSLASNYESAHLIFMLRLSRQLGFGPQFVNEILVGRVTDEETEKALDLLLRSDYYNLPMITNAQRRNILDLLLRFYADHLENFGELRSVQVLREVLG
jgi:DNA repair protein RecO (recombination protein O)